MWFLFSGLVQKKYIEKDKRKFDELEQKKISDTFAALPRDFLRKNIDSVSSRLQKGVSKNGAMLKSDNKWSSAGFKMAQGL